ncbi:MAG: peptide-methionine (S)-S-oxide reductase MsrA [Spirochaetota bacterium]
MKDTEKINNLETAVLGGGCFWCIEAVFERIDGIEEAVSGYAGGTTEDPTYKEVCSGSTGHAEVVRLRFDPSKITYDEVLDIFFKAHDPTTVNRQGADVGSQYRSIILYSSEEQKRKAEAALKRARKNYSDPLVTEIVPLNEFYEAEDYHQDYYDVNPNAPYCRMVIDPKLTKLGL